MTPRSFTVTVTRRLPASCENRLGGLFSVRWGNDEQTYDREAILELTQGAQGLIVTPAESLDADTISALPDSLEVISCFSVGYEHIDIEAARERDIIVTNTPGVLTEATADITWLLILGAARRASEGEHLVRSGTWRGWRPTQLLGAQLSTRTLGILGMGRIGQAVARRARGFGMKIIYHNRSPLPDEQSEGAEFVDDVNAFLSMCDILTLHAPLTPQTHNFLNADRIAQLPDSAIVINTGRGPLVDDDALIEALSHSRIAAAGLDVYTGEPQLDARYRDLKNTFLLPHLGSATAETREAMGMLAIDNLVDVLDGRPPAHRVA